MVGSECNNDYDEIRRLNLRMIRPIHETPALLRASGLITQ